MALLRRISIGILVIGIILLAVVMGGLRLAIVNIENFKPEIQYLLARDVSPGIVFTGISGSLNRFNPILRIENVSINLPDRSQPLFIDRLAVEFNFWASLREQTPVVLEITSQLEKLELIKDKSGRWWTNDLAIGGGVNQAKIPGFRQALTLVPRYLNINLQRLIIQDQQTGTTHQLERVNAHINHRKDQFYMQLTTALPDELGRGILIKSVIGPERGVVYINTSDLRLNPVATLFDLDTWGLQDGAMDGEVWINMAGYRVIAVNGDLVLKNGLVQVSADKTPLAVNYHSRFSAINRKSNWRVTNEFRRLEIDDKRVSGFRTQLEFATIAKQNIVSAWIDRLEVSSLPVVVGQWLPAEISAQIAQSKMQGLLQDVLLRINLARADEFKASGRATGISSHAFGSYPGTDNLNADILLGQNKLGLHLQGEAVSLDFGDLFRAPIKLDTFELDATVNRHEAGILLSVNEFKANNQDINTSGRMWLKADQGERPFMYLRANFTDGHGSSTGKYLPVRILPEKTLAWLDRGIQDAYVPAGDMLFHGRVSDIKAHNRNKSGEFFVDFNVENADIFFSPGWLHAKNGTGRVVFHNDGLELDLDRVSYDQLDYARVQGGIANFKNAVLELAIKAKLPTADAVRIWIDTPVGKQYRKAVSNLHGLGGDVKTEIKLRLPLAKGSQPKVHVAVDFENARTQAENWGLDLTQIKGKLEVTEDSITASQLSAKYFGDPVKIDIETDKSSGNTLVKASGLIESRNLLKTLPNVLTQNITGKSNWQVRLNFASSSAAPELPFLRLNAASNLKQTHIGLPQPFAKLKDKSVRLSADLDFHTEQIRFNSSFGDSIRARGQLSANSRRDFELSSLDLAFSSELKPKPGLGLHLYGKVPEISIDDWIRVINTAGGAKPKLLQTAQLNIDRVNAYNHILENVEFELKQTQGEFLGSIDASLIKGSFQSPLQPSAQNPLVVELEYLRLDKLEQESDYSALRPSELLDFRISSQAMVYHDMLFNDLLIEARVIEDVLYVDELSMRRDQVFIKSSGQWKYDAVNDSHLSSITAIVKGEKFGEAIAGIGFGDSLSGGTINLNAGFTWPAPLLGVNLENLIGEAKLEINDGILNNVEAGSGRFVGLLSLGALPRRLSLDFSDVLIEGMEFDKITGSYRIKDGILSTKNTRMDGTVAKIKITGKTGIINRDYDQKILVIPKVRQTLPLIGAITSGATVGWGLLLLQNLFKKSIDNAVEVEYRVTGSWDDPQIELVKAVDENRKALPNNYR